MEKTMIYFLVLVLLWKPIYYLVRYFMLNGKDTEQANIYLSQVKTWFVGLWALIYPGELK